MCIATAVANAVPGNIICAVYATECARRKLSNGSNTSMTVCFDGCVHIKILAMHGSGVMLVWVSDLDGLL
jgi:hypothetical protein